MSPALLLGAPAIAAPPSPVLKTMEYDGKGKLHDTYADMGFTIDAIGPPDVRGPRLRVMIDGKPAFKLQLPGEGSDARATVKVVRLDGEGPQIIFEHLSGGSHCCMDTKIATRVDGHWVAVAGDGVGNEGYDFKDVEGNGISELLSSDQSFLGGRFDSEASSVAPIVVQKLEGAKLVDVTRDSRFRKAVHDDLVRIETYARSDDGTWHEYGFLAGWVATKAMLGEGPEAWKIMLKNVDPKADWPMGEKVCPELGATDGCPKDKMRPETFPEALRAHLLDRGYIKDLAAYPLPPAASK